MSFYLLQDILLKALNQYLLQWEIGGFIDIIWEFPNVLAAPDNYYTVCEEYEVAMNTAAVCVSESLEDFGMDEFEHETFLKYMNDYLSCLNSCPYNLRFPGETTGNIGSRWNSSIQENYDPEAWRCLFNNEEVSNYTELGPGVPMGGDLSWVTVELSDFDRAKIEIMDEFCTYYEIDASIKLATAYTVFDGEQYPFVYSSSNLFEMPLQCTGFIAKTIL